MTRPRCYWGLSAQLFALLLALPAFAADAAPAAAGPPKIDTGDTAWMLTGTALVLLMTIPGLALFYAGMVRKKNVLARFTRRSPTASGRQPAGSLSWACSTSRVAPSCISMLASPA